MHLVGTKLTVLFALEPAERVADSATEADVARTGTVVMVVHPTSDGLVDTMGEYLLDMDEGGTRSVIPDQVLPPTEAERWFRARLDRVHHTQDAQRAELAATTLDTMAGCADVVTHLDVEDAFEATCGVPSQY